MLILRGAMLGWGHGAYEKSLYLPLNFVVNIKKESEVAQSCLTL